MGPIRSQETRLSLMAIMGRIPPPKWVASPPWGKSRPEDLNWIKDNRTVLWLATTVAFEEIGYGFIFVDLTEQTEGEGHPFGYYSEGELEPQQDGKLRRLLEEYDPDREFISLLWKGEERSDVCVGTRPPMGGYVGIFAYPNKKDHFSRFLSRAVCISQFF